MDTALRRFRKRQNISVTEMCKAVGISRSSLYRIEIGQQNAPLSVAQKIAAITGGEITPNDLVASLSQPASDEAAA